MRQTAILVFVFSTLAIGLHSRADVLGPTPVALSGQPSPAGSNFASFGTPVLNAAGQVAFYSTLNASSAGGIFTGNAGSWQTVALRNGAAPGGGTYSVLYGPFAMNALGQVVFHASVNGDSIFAGAPGSVQLVARQGGPAPGGGTYTDLDGTGRVVGLNDAGQVAFAGEVMSGRAIFDGVFAGIPGAIQAVAETGNSAPDGGTFSELNPPPLNAANQVAFQASVLKSGGIGSGVFLGTSAALEPAALDGVAAPGGGTYSAFTKFVGINSAGQVAFGAFLSGSSSTQGIFAGAVGSVLPVALVGTPAPSGGNYSSLGIPQINGTGVVSFEASVAKDGTTISGLFEGSPGAVDVIAKAGDNVPGGGVFNFFTASQQVAMNASGQLVFAANLIGPEVDTTNDRGLYAGTPGHLTKIVREGDVIDVDPGPGIDDRIVKQFASGSGGGQDGQGPFLNDAGLLVYELSFTDGSSGIFTSYIGAAPQTGDFNHDGMVDAADYVAWRKGLGVTYSQSDYDTWRTAFGQTIAASGTLPNARVIPEPTFAVLLLLLIVLSRLFPLRLRAFA